MWPFSRSKKDKNKQEQATENPQGFSKLITETGELYFDLPAEFEKLLKARGINVVRDDDLLVDQDTEIILQPLIFELKDAPHGGIHLITTVSAFHNTHFPDGLTEFQHGMGDDINSGFEFGMNQWIDLDYPVICDATRAEPKDCMVMEMSFPSEDGKTEINRRVLLGPTGHMSADSFQEKQKNQDCEDDNCEEEHNFCPCCLVTNSFDQFMPLFQSNQLLGVRLLASRDDNGNGTADCRVNTEEFPAGEQALIKYAEGWDDHGFEMRKQYVIFQDSPEKEKAA